MHAQLLSPICQWQMAQYCRLFIVSAPSLQGVDMPSPRSWCECAGLSCCACLCVCTEDPLVGSIAQQYLADREAHDKTAAEWVKRYASGA